MIRLIGLRWKPRKRLSREILITKKPFSFFSIASKEAILFWRKVDTHKFLLFVAFLHSIFQCGVSGVFCRAGTPDPIPNSAVKRLSADGSLYGQE